MIYIFENNSRFPKSAGCCHRIKELLANERYKSLKFTPKTINIDPYKVAIMHELTFTQASALKIFKNLEKEGFKGSYALVKRFVAKLKPGNQDTKIILNGK